MISSWEYADCIRSLTLGDLNIAALLKYDTAESWVVPLKWFDHCLSLLQTD